jgi:SAM-dependent methyltransferase
MILDTMLLSRKLSARLFFGALFGHTRKRKKIAHKWLSGYGIEIGALHNPLSTDAVTHVTYVDRMDNEELLRHYPDLSNRSLVPIGVVDDGEFLLSINDMSQDFVIANHFLEHCINPIGALQTWIRVLKFGGIAYIAVPDKRFTFDYKRAATTWNHFLADNLDTDEHSNKGHYIDWIRNVLKVPEKEIEDTLAHLLRTQYSIHFHTWTANTLHAFFRKCRDDLGLYISICEFKKNGYELIAILKKELTR